MDDKKPRHDKPFDRFYQLTSRLLAVPKKEVDKKEAAYQRKRAKKKRPQP